MPKTRRKRRLWYALTVPDEVTVILRVLIGTGLGFVIGFERGVRGSSAGDRTFSLVGAASAGITAVFFARSPQAVAGVVTGIGFIGGGVVLHDGQGNLVKGITTAATVFMTAAIGLVVGAGRPWAGLLLAGLCVVILEVRYLPVLKYLDSQRYRDRFGPDKETEGPPI